MEDTYKHKGLRKKLVDSLKAKGIEDEEVLKAIGKVPRHVFMENVFLEHAYEDKAFPIGSGQTISQPYTVAFQTQLLKIKKGDKVLEIGTGSGYQTCILLELGAKVYTIERQKTLFEKTKILLPEIGYNPKFFYGDGYKGLPAYAPFDKILVTAGAPHIPEALIEQLKVDGIMVIPVGATSVQVMTSLIKKNEGETEINEHGYFQFVPLLKDKEWKSQ
ncbi:MAG: protein-L-isoaspartate(D-aspartate) O-methyltransferase [Bacteroidetes bacterium]|nr:protein-L-isoaspartate(D-aspartate) O-methyltransferase [Bacteroidota bacterium]HET6243026.1 protein-L-isoaspartate(D-aspartate) O-methyltransferase [Bacteroidia bacterium]